MQSLNRCQFDYNLKHNSSPLLFNIFLLISSISSGRWSNYSACDAYKTFPLKTFHIGILLVKFVLCCYYFFLFYLLPFLAIYCSCLQDKPRSCRHNCQKLMIQCHSHFFYEEHCGLQSISLPEYILQHMI